MHVIPNLLLMVLTIAGGCIPLFTHVLSGRRLMLLMAFSGSFLLGVTCLHLLPETFADLPNGAGPYLLLGFFLQLLIQRLTHGVEHGHVHDHDHTDAPGHEHTHSIPILSILAGLSLHAAMEGIPLGVNYRNAATNSSLFMAIGAHKLPEAMLLGILLHQNFGKMKTFLIMCGFSVITPVVALLSSSVGSGSHSVTRTVSVLIAVVAGAFIHISTTIFFESGTRHHMLTGKKIATMIVGISMVALTLFLE